MTSFRAAVVFHGAGVYDGAEITEATSLLISLNQQKAQIQVFAPDRDQFHVVNHLNGTEQKNQTRNILQESARIARGAIKPLSELKVSDFDALFMPGGFGVAKNFSDFNSAGGNLTVTPDCVELIQSFNKASKYMVFTCISPLLAAKVLGKNSGGPGVTLTLGSCGDEANWPYQGSIGAATSFGNTLVEADIHEVVIDKENKILTCPAYMKGPANHAEVFANIQSMVEQAAVLIRQDTASVPVSLVVNVEIKGSEVAAFQTLIKTNAAAARLEPGCLKFDVLQDQKDETKFIFYETYVSQAAVDAHKLTAPYAAWAAFKASGAVTAASAQKLNLIF